MDPVWSPGTVAARDRSSALVHRHRAARAAYNRAMDEHVAALDTPIEIGIDESSSAFVDTLAYRRARAARDEMAAIEVDYFGQLPRLAIAPCPHCERPLYRSFDPFGVEGLWWRSDASPDEPAACPHFCVMLGAVDLGGSRPMPDFDVHPGPGAPFVIPRLLDHAGMIAVVSEIPMTDGSRAYPVTYFAPRRPPIQTLAAPWPRTNFVYVTQLGVQAWRRADEPPVGSTDDRWDFDLAPWIAGGRLRWCDPGTDGTRLSAGSPATCPFIDLGGARSPQVILGTVTTPPDATEPA